MKPSQHSSTFLFTVGHSSLEFDALLDALVTALRGQAQGFAFRASAEAIEYS